MANEATDSAFVRDWIRRAISMSKSFELAEDAMVALGRTLDRCVRESEELLTVEQRLRYYQLRDEGVAPLDAFVQLEEEEQ